MLDKTSVLKEWLKIEYFSVANRLGFIDKKYTAQHKLIEETIRALDHETTMVEKPDINYVITILSLMWEHTDHNVYNFRDLFIKMLTRIGYPTSAIIADPDYNSDFCQFASMNSIIDEYIVTILQNKNEITVGNQTFLLTEFQKNLFNTLNENRFVGISAPTSAGKSFLILLYAITLMSKMALDIIYIVPTLSLLNQVTEDFNTVSKKVGFEDYFITHNLPIGESKCNHTIYVWTQEKAIATLSTVSFPDLPNRTLLVVDEIQNIERVSEADDVRAKILYDTIQELRQLENVYQVVISGPRIDNISGLGYSLFGNETVAITTTNSPVLNLTYGIRKIANKYYLKQYCGISDDVICYEIQHPEIVSGYGRKGLDVDFLEYLRHIVLALNNSQNIVFAPTSTASRKIASSLLEGRNSSNNRLSELAQYLRKTVHRDYALATALEYGVVYHHGKLPVHVRRTIEKAIKLKYVSNVVSTTTLVQGVNLPAQNIIIRNPHLYIKRNANRPSPELTNYEMANLRGRAGRLLKDYIGRTIVLDESEFVRTEGYSDENLFEDVYKNIPSGYGDTFERYRHEILDVANSYEYVSNEMLDYGYLVTYIRQSILRHGNSAQRRMAETGVYLTKEQIAAIKLKLNSLSVPLNICKSNRYWDPFVLDSIYKNFNGPVPNMPFDSSSRSMLLRMLLFLRDNEYTKTMFERNIPPRFHDDKSCGLLCSICIKWAKEIPLRDILSGSYFTGDEATEHIESTIQILQQTVSFDIPILIKPLIEIRNENSIFLTCLQEGAYRRITRKMIEMGVPRELAISLFLSYFVNAESSFLPTSNNFDLELFVRGQLKHIIPSLEFWEAVQLDFLN